MQTSSSNARRRGNSPLPCFDSVANITQYEDARLTSKGVDPGAKKAAPKKRKAKEADGEASTSKKAKKDEAVAPALLLG